MERRTELRLPIGSAPEAWVRSLRRIADEMRARPFNAGRQAEDLDTLADRFHEALTPPTLRGVLAGLRHPLAWPTREHALWMAKQLQEGARIVTAIVAGFERKQRAAQRAELAKRALGWVEALGLHDPADKPDPAPP